MTSGRQAYSPTIEAVESELAAKGPVTSAEVVAAILRRHPQYGEGTARDVREGPWPDGLSRQPVADWLRDVLELFDPELVQGLHGRLVILGLCHLDELLGRHLRGFRAALERELHEDFESLLLPEHAGAESYRRDFLKILQNRGKLSSSEPAVRSRGFLILIEGGPGLETLSRLCFKQGYNECLTARYVLTARSTMQDFTRSLLEDLRSLRPASAERGSTAAGSSAAPSAATLGEFLPEDGTRRPGSGPLMLWRNRPERFYAPLDSLGANAAPADILGELFHAWESLETGQRLVLFVEWRSLGGADSASLGLDEGLVKVLMSIPERVGVVLSGLPAEIAATLAPAEPFTLTLPPDRELTRGQKLLNDTPVGPDRLNILGEVHALAEAIALKDMHPPLVVGIFGGWGSGKSFVMYLLEQRLQEIRCERIDDDGRFPFVGHPYLIRFDAWTYAKGDLWASLMQTTLLQLDRQLSLEQKLAEGLGLDLRESTEAWRLLGSLTDDQKERLLNTDLGKKALEIVETFEEQASIGELWNTLETLRRDEKGRLEAKEAELRDLRERAAAARAKVGNEADREIAAAARRTAWLPVGQELRHLVEAKLEAGGAPGFDEIVETISPVGKFWVGVRQLSLPAIAFMVLALAGGFALDMLNPLFSGYGEAAGVLLAALTPALKAMEWFNARRSEYEERLAQATASKAVSREALIEELIASGGSGTAAAKARELDARLRDAEGEAELLRARVGITGRSRSLVEFLRERIDKQFYEEKLGLLHQIQTDIQELSDTLVPSRALGVIDRDEHARRFPRGDPRVVLFIDDLDRCPPDKVVEVLEAAQLLVKTRLFVVVIAIDVRYVTRALEAQYKDVLVRSGEPSGLDYIEKIIQIPYRVRTASDSAIRNFLRSQMDFNEPAEETERRPSAPESGDAAPPPASAPAEEVGITPQVRAARTELRVLPTKVIHFDSDEHEAISAACSAVGVSPRTMKRLVNIFKLLKIIWFRQGLEKGPAPEVKQAMLSLLALSARYPEVLRQLLARMEGAYRGEASPGSRKLVDFLEEETRKGALTALYPPDWHRVGEALQLEEFFPQALTFSGLEEPNLHLLSSFSFVGETDSEREATLKRGFYRAQPGASGAMPQASRGSSAADAAGAAGVANAGPAGD